MMLFFKDIIISLLIVAIVIGSIWGYTRSWPPMVVIESGSMSHSPESMIGVIDAGDLVLVKSIDGREDIETYAEGDNTGHDTYGEYGDVIVYYKNGYTGQIPVIHRAMVWIEYNVSTGGYDVPSMDLYDVHDSFRMENVGYDHLSFNIDIAGIIRNFNDSSLEPHSGFITLGDHNHGSYDQGGWMGDGFGRPVLPVKPEWVIGKARGELPWFGAIKLCLTDKDKHDGVGCEAVPSNSKTNLAISILVMIAVPIALDLISFLFIERRERKEDEGDGKDERAREESEDETEQPDKGTEDAAEKDKGEEKEYGQDTESEKQELIDNGETEYSENEWSKDSKDGEMGKKVIEDE